MVPIQWVVFSFSLAVKHLLAYSEFVTLKFNSVLLYTIYLPLHRKRAATPLQINAVKQGN
jgi:hypothetical protein